MRWRQSLRACCSSINIKADTRAWKAVFQRFQAFELCVVVTRETCTTRCMSMIRHSIFFRFNLNPGTVQYGAFTF